MSLRDSTYAKDGMAYAPDARTYASDSAIYAPDARVLRRPDLPALRLPAAASLLAPVALAGLVAATAILCVAAAHTGGLLPETMRPAPAWLAGPLGGTGLRLGNTALILTLLATFACYAVASASAERVSARFLVVTIVALHVLVVLAPPLFSTDMFSYQIYGRMGALHGVNPYLAGPHAVIHDPLYAYVGYKWTGTPTVYGPLFTVLSYGLASLSIAASVWVYKSLAAVASLLVVGLVWKIARGRGHSPARAIALVGLNPLLVIYGVGGGHNDLLMLLPLLGGIYLLLSGRTGSGAASMVVAPAIKLAGGLPLLFALADRSRTERSERRLLAGAAAALGALALLGIGVFGRGMLHLPGTVGQVQSDGGWHSFPGFLVKGFGLGGYHNPISIGLGLLCLSICCWLLIRVWQRRLDWIQAAGWGAVAVLVTASSLLPWYVVWLLPLAALGGSRRLRYTTIVLTGAILMINLIDYFPHSSFMWSL